MNCVLDIGLDNDFLDLTPKKATKAKLNKQDYIKLKAFASHRKP